MFTRKKFITLLFALVMVIGVLTAEAGISFIGSVKVGGGSVTADGKIAGFGNNQDATVKMQVQGSNLTAYCRNKGGNIAPGQNLVNVATDSAFVISPDTNGNYFFNFHEEILPTSLEAGCPNSNWTVVDLSGPLSVTLAAYEPGATVPADQQVFSCVAQFGTVVSCTRVQ